MSEEKPVPSLDDLLTAKWCESELLEKPKTSMDWVINTIINSSLAEQAAIAGDLNLAAKYAGAAQYCSGQAAVFALAEETAGTPGADVNPLEINTPTASQTPPRE